MIKRASFLSLVLLVIVSAFSQDNMSSSVVSVMEKIPASPNVASLGKYFEIPVNMATGVPNISIPLFTIKSGNITVPITLSYHAAGNRVNDLAGWTGMGWTLYSGGSIIKTVNGLDDHDAVENYSTGVLNNPTKTYIQSDYSSYTNFGFTSMSHAVDCLMVINSSYVSQDPINRFFGTINLGVVDGEADEFRYSTPEGSGSFYYNQKKGQFDITRINGWMVQQSGDLFTLHTNNGKQYDFGNVELTINPQFESLAGSQLQYLKSAYHLTQIRDIVHDKQVNFTYYQDTTNIYMGQTNYVDYHFYAVGWVYLGGGGQDLYRKGFDYIPKEIIFDEGKVVFVRSTSSRTDGGGKLLTEIQLYNTKNQLIKKFALAYDIVGGRPFLKSVQEVGANNGTLPSYQIRYNTSVTLPARFSYAQDFWGYYNGKTSNTSIIPSYPNHSSPIIPGADRRVDTNYTKAGIIKDIIYPMGGRLSFEFENNREGTAFLGGLRVKRVINYDSLATSSLVTEYAYEALSLNYLQINPVYGFEFTKAEQNWSIFYSALRLNGNSTLPLFPNQGSPLLYGKVEKRQVSASGDLLSKHYFRGITPDNLSVLTSYQNFGAGVPYPKFWNSSDYAALETEVEHYKRNSNSTYTLIQRDSTIYDFLNGASDHIWNVQSTWYNPTVDYKFWEAPENDPYSTNPMNLNPSVNAYKVFKDAPVALRKFSTSYTDQGPIRQASFFEYDKTNGNLKKSKVLNSIGDTTITTINYPSDYPILSNNPGNEIDYLYAYNYLSAPIETVSYLKKAAASDATIKGGTVLDYEGLRIKKVRTLDKDFTLSGFVAATSSSSGLSVDSRYRRPQEVLSYNANGKPLTVDNNGDKVSYLWNTSSTHMLGQVINATSSNVAYTSFEGDDGGGGWTGTSAGYFDSSTQGVTGDKFYNQASGFTLSKSGLNAGTSYTVTYWSKNGAYSITGTQNGYPKTLSTTTLVSASWTLYEHLVTGQSTINVVGSGALDELRLYPSGAQMVTNTHRSLIGLTSQSDANNLITYYEYDEFGRVKVVRDQNGKVLRKHEYKYASQ